MRQHRAAVTAGAGTLFSLQSLLDLAATITATRSNSGTVVVGRQLMECVAQRLAVQERVLQGWRLQLQQHEEQQSSPQAPVQRRVIRTADYHTPLWKKANPATKASTTTTIPPAAFRKLDTLQWIHKDTQQQCLHILSLGTTNPQQPHLIRQTLTEVQARHARTVETLAELVVQDLRPHGMVASNDNKNDGVVPRLNPSIPVFLSQRLGIQVLCEHYMELTHPKSPKPYGTIDYQRSLSETVLDAVGETNILTQAYYDVVPEMKLKSLSSLSLPTATFVGSWLHYVLTEVLKNAVTATHAATNTNTTSLPSIDISIVDDDDDDDDSQFVYIHIDDAGEGYDSDDPKKKHKKTQVFEFAQTKQIWDRINDQTTYAMIERSPIQGLGVGLHLSNCMMEYFGGRLWLQSHTSGGGTRATLAIPRDLTILEAPSWGDIVVDNDDKQED